MASVRFAASVRRFASSGENPAPINACWAYLHLESCNAPCGAKLKKRTLTNLYNERPAWLDLAHKKLDAAVAAAYGWPPDLTDDQTVERLLALNLECAAEEQKSATKKKPRVSREKHDHELI